MVLVAHYINICLSPSFRHYSLYSELGTIIALYIMLIERISSYVKRLAP